jgi:hypothetical protein
MREKEGKRKEREKERERQPAYSRIATTFAHTYSL